MSHDFPQHLVGSLQEHGARLLDSRKVGTATDVLARDLLAGFFDTCMRSGLDGLLVALEQSFSPLDITDRTGLGDHAGLVAALVAKLEAVEIDGGGPRNAKPRQAAECLVAALGLTLVDVPSETTTLDGDVRTEVVAALAGVVDAELAVPQIRDAIIASARQHCEERHLGAFDKICAQLDERGIKLLKTPKVPLDALQATQRLLFDARTAVVERTVRKAFDRAKDVIARVDEAAAARIDSPITHRLTPRDVAVIRANDARVPKAPAAIVASLIESLTELARITWRPPKQNVRTYAASQTFAVGDVLEHPKFGRGSVVSVLPQRIEVEFPDGKHTLVHGKT